MGSLRITLVRRIAAPVAVLGLAATGLVTQAPEARADGPGVGTPYVATLGDSYISGEAGRWAGSSNTSSTAADALGGTAYYDCEHRDCATTWGLTLAYDRPCGCPRVDVSAPGGGVHQAAGRVGSDLIGA